MTGKEPEGAVDPTDAAYWCSPRFAIKAPPPPVLSMLSCQTCASPAYSDGAGDWICMTCGAQTQSVSHVSKAT